MATIWARQNGNYNANIWNYYNDDSGQIEAYPYNTIRDGDTAYSNGFAVTFPSEGTVTLSNSIISNESVEIKNSDNETVYTTTTGGYFMCGLRAINLIFKEFRVANTFLFYQNAQGSFTGNVYIMGAGTFCYKVGSNREYSWTLNGNVYVYGGGVVFNDASFNSSHNIINGNVISYTNTNDYITRNGTANLTINGNVVWNGVLGGKNVNISGSYSLSSVNISLTTLKVYGNVAIGHLAGITATTFNYYGDKVTYYDDSHNIAGLKLTTFNIYSDNFQWVNLSEPRTLKYIILTDYDLNNRQQYPAEDEVKEGTEYIWGQKVGTYTPDYPPESVVLNGYEYDNGDMVGSMSQSAQVGCVTPEDVREDVPLVGMGVVGSLVVPSVDDVREGVIFDNGSVGTLIVQGGGDRLRIADFGYYTNAQSDTYIVDLTEQDKPKFAVAEERVLIEMFPDLDLDNIPEKYFDDLFVKYLKYRLIVEYYRTAGINSTFTPSEPTTEIVNYQNVRNEVWLNSANIYLKSWARKYPNSIMKPQRILL